MAHLPESFIDEVLSRVDVVELIGAQVQLKRSGANWVGLCPFHHEKTPSFSVSSDKQFYHCFGCGKGGNAFRFLMEHDGYSFPEAVSYLAEKVGLDVPRENSYDQEKERQQQARRKVTVTLLEQAATAFVNALHTPQAEPVRQYIQKRGLPDAVVQTYQLGFAPAGYGFMAKNLGNSPQELAELESVGLLFKGEHGYGDRFRDRLMFPIRNHRGELVGFGGRIMQGDAAKYLNSPETSLFHKSELLYGLSEHREQIRKRKMLLVVEGYMDVLALAAFELPVALAPLGTAIGESQIRQIFRLCESPVFCFDGDQAGYQAAWRALERMLPLLKPEYRPRFLYLPEGEDPDSLFQQEGREAFEARVQNDAKPTLETWLLGLQKLSGSGADGLARMAKKADAMLATMSDDYLRQAWKLEIEKKTAIQLHTSTPKSRFSPPIGRANFRSPNHLLSDQFLAALLQKPERFSQLPIESKQFMIDNHAHQLLYTRAFSLQESEAYNRMTWANLLQREFPDAVEQISRWMNQEPVADIEFTSLVLDMRKALLQRNMATSSDLAEIAQLKKLETVLKNEQKELNAEMDEQRRGNE